MSLINSKSECLNDLEKNKILSLKTRNKMKTEEIEEDIIRDDICQNLSATEE